MKKFIPFIFLFAATLDAAVITRGVYVEDPTQTTAIFKLRASAPTPVWLEYGPAPECRQIMTLSPENIEHKIVLYGLVANKEFCYNAYVLNDDMETAAPPVSGRFKTLATPDRKEIKFAVFGNSAGDNLEGRQKLSAALSKENVNFYIHTGNLISTGLDIDADAEFFTPFGPLLLNAPLFVAAGENEFGDSTLPPAERRKFFRSNYARAHTMTWGKGTPYYYYFDTANARFIFLDTVNTPFTKESDQYKWLRASLASTEGGKWKIVTLHNPLKTTGPSALRPVTEQRRQDEEDLAGLLEYYGVNLVLQGADAAFERTFPIRRNRTEGVDEENEKGIVYMTFGAGGSKRLDKRMTDSNWTARFVSAQSYGVFEIADRRLSFKVYNLDGKLLDSADIPFN